MNTKKAHIKCTFDKKYLKRNFGFENQLGFKLGCLYTAVNALVYKFWKKIYFSKN